jgi:hypothetical protein
MSPIKKQLTILFIFIDYLQIFLRIPGLFYVGFSHFIDNNAQRHHAEAEKE